MLQPTFFFKLMVAIVEHLDMHHRAGELCSAAPHHTTSHTTPHHTPPHPTPVYTFSSCWCPFRCRPVTVRRELPGPTG